MRSLATVACWEGVVLLVGFFGIFFWKLSTGCISLNGLLEGDVRSGHDFSSQASGGRVQALVVTLFLALWYLLQVIHNPREFPTVSDAMVAALAGSQTIYLGGKAQAMFLGPLRNLFK